MGEQFNSSAIICCFSSKLLGMAPSLQPRDICSVFSHVQKIDMVVVKLSSCVENEYKHHSCTLHVSLSSCFPKHDFILICSGKNIIFSSWVRHSTLQLIDSLLNYLSPSVTAVGKFSTITVWWSTTRLQALSAPTSETWWVFLKWSNYTEINISLSTCLY